MCTDIFSTGIKIKVYICLKDTAKFLEINVKLSNAIGAVKWIIYKNLYIPPDMQVLRYCGKNLENDKTVEYYKIEVSGTIYLTPEGIFTHTHAHARTHTQCIAKILKFAH